MCDIFTNTDIFLHAKGLADGAPLKQGVDFFIFPPRGGKMPSQT
jgi:hypothetical protein